MISFLSGTLYINILCWAGRYLEICGPGRLGQCDWNFKILEIDSLSESGL